MLGSSPTNDATCGIALEGMPWKPSGMGRHPVECRAWTQAHFEEDQLKPVVTRVTSTNKKLPKKAFQNHTGQPDKLVSQPRMSWQNQQQQPQFHPDYFAVQLY